MNGLDIAAQIAAGLREAGIATGAGPLVATISRRGIGSGPEYAPVAGWPATYDVVVIDSNIKEKDMAGNLTGEITRRLLVEASGVVPQTGDWITVRGVCHSIAYVETIAPAGVDLMYKVTLAR
jgi:hypothetical protein